MPLLGKEEFCLKSLPDNLSPDEQVFYCQITGEAFLSYDEYFERQFLYSSLLWTCSVTGRTGLTYSEALKSEQESQALVSSIPTVLQKAMLHLMTYMNNFSTNVTLSILIEYTNFRYFIGEHVQISPKNKNKRFNGIIRDVIPPENYEKSSSIAYGIDPLAYNYQVEYIDQPDKHDGNGCIIIPAARISRSKFLLTREKIRLFLKQHLAPKNGRYQALSIKTESLQKFGVDQLNWENIFKGPTPNFSDDTLIVKALSRQRYSEENNSHNLDSLKENDENREKKLIQILKKKSNLLSSQKQKLKRRETKQGNSNNTTKESNDGKRKYRKNLKKDAKSKRQNSKNKSGKVSKKTTSDATDSNETQESKSSKQKDNDKDLKNRERECRKQYEEDLKNWTEKRDDLLCDDLLPLPEVTPIECDIPSEMIGDALVIVDFLNVFHEFLAFEENTFPSHLTLDYFIKILQDNNVNSRAGFADLIMAILRTIFQSNMKDSHDGNDDLKIQDINNEDFDLFNADNDEESTASQVNCFANHFVTTYFSTLEQLARLQMDPFTITEILRIYILKTRNFDGKRTTKICLDDMALVMRLATQTIFELNQTDRIKILKIVLNDVVVQVSDIRQKIETSMDEMFKLKIRIRHLNAAYTRWLRENPIRQRMRRKKTCPNNDNEQQQTEPEPELTKEEKEQYKNDKAEREKKMKDDIAELKTKIRRLSAFCRSRPLGTDRRYRKYWIFETIPGLFVEQPVHDEYNSNTCFDDPVPVVKPIFNDYLANAKRRKKKIGTIVPTEETETNKVVEENIDRCTGNPSTCKVHDTMSRTTTQLWSFYSKEQFDNLLNSLNSRGFRESELKNALEIEKQSILDNHFAEFDPFTFNPNYIPPPVIEMIEPEMSDDVNPVRKSERLQIHDRTAFNNKRRSTRSEFCLEFSDQTPVEVFDVNFQNQLAIFEDNVFNGCFCSFSISDRDAWYHGLNRTYCQDKINSLQMLTDKLATLARSIRPFCLMPPLSVYPESTMSSPSEKENIDNNQALKFRVPMLSEKWLDVLKVPDSSELTEFESSYGITNHSQLFLNLYIFERSLNWEMSALKTANKCGICRRKANDEMILCDFCNRGYHIYCLTPPISSINEIEGDWYCPKCLPRSSPDHESSSNRRTAQTTKVEVEETHQQDTEQQVSPISNDKISQQTVNESLLERCKSCRKHIFDSFSEVSCKTCCEYFHLRCVNLVRVPRSWNCAACAEKERYDEQYNNNPHNDNDNNELRRSQRKRKPNHYHEFEPNDDHYHHQSTTSNHLKSRRCSDGQNSEYHRIIVK